MTCNCRIQATFPNLLTQSIPLIIWGHVSQKLDFSISGYITWFFVTEEHLCCSVALGMDMISFSLILRVRPPLRESVH